MLEELLLRLSSRLMAGERQTWMGSSHKPSLALMQ